jgi:putative spermidine/putrescine transport system permease protein
MSRRLLFLLLVLISVGPLLLIGVASFGQQWFAPALLPTVWTTAAWRELLGGPSRLGEAFITSLTLAVVTGVVSMILGLVIARLLARATAAWRQLGAAAAFLPVITPPIALATGLQFVLLRAGIGGTPFGVLVAHVIPATGYAAIYLLGVCLSHDVGMEDEARTLGATPWQTFRLVVLPLFRMPLVEAFALGWLVSWSQVPLTILVGGGAVRSLAVEVFAFVQAGQDRFAATGALLLVIPAITVLALVRRAGGTVDVAPV